MSFNREFGELTQDIFGNAEVHVETISQKMLGKVSKTLQVRQNHRVK